MARPTPTQRIEILLEMHRYNVALGQAYLEYRENITKVVITVYSGLLGVTFLFDIGMFSVLFPVLVVVFSRFTEKFVLKFYERSEYHFSRSRLIREQIDTDFSTGFESITDIFKRALVEHKAQFVVKGRPGWSDWLLNSNVHERWASLHRIFTLSAFLVTLVVITNNYDELHDWLKIAMDWIKSW